MEKEIREVKAKNRELTQSLANTQSNIAEPNQVVDKNDPRVRSLVTQLNETIGKTILARRELWVTNVSVITFVVVGSLRQEKLDLTSQVRKYEATVMHLQTLLHQSSNEVSFVHYHSLSKSVAWVKDQNISNGPILHSDSSKTSEHRST